ncbi:MAG: hypothetical protein JSW61_15055 [Candidatus Thorarchaeota archaeon]|nr:MAG: hypothetical protein JSW61_15055 [Candidatus Thorarchaeota archaeon]
MVEKAFKDRLHLEVHPSRMTFDQVDGDLTASFDEGLLQKHLPPTGGVLSADSVLATTLQSVLPQDTVQALEETEFVDVFGRVVCHPSDSDFICLQYLYIWDYQAVPVHEGDYEPIFVYVRPDSRYAIYDLVHYCTRRIDLAPPGDPGPGLLTVPGWHSFLPTGNLPIPERDQGLAVKPLTDQHLESWWTIPSDNARFKIEKFMRDPFQLEAPGHFLENPDEESQTICCAFLEIERAMQEIENPKDAFVEGLKRALAKCVGLLTFYRAGHLLKLLAEMNDVGMITLPGPLDLFAIAGLISGGLMSLSESGRRFFDGFGSSNEPDSD